MARHRCASNSPTISRDLSKLLTPTAGRKHRPPTRRFDRHPIAALAAALIVTALITGSQPASVPASAQALRAANVSVAEASQRSVSETASRSDRPSIESEPVVPPIVGDQSGSEEALVPELDSAGSANGPTGSAAVTGDPCPTEGFGGVKPHVAQAGWHLTTVFGLSESDVGGVAQRQGNPASDHPRGYALDFMVDTSTGDALAAYAEQHTNELGIKYILWQVPNHYDHVHISFNDRPGSGMTC